MDKSSGHKVAIFKRIAAAAKCLLHSYGCIKNYARAADKKRGFEKMWPRDEADS
jgi:hypothetical protein